VYLFLVTTTASALSSSSTIASVLTFAFATTQVSEFVPKLSPNTNPQRPQTPSSCPWHCPSSKLRRAQSSSQQPGRAQSSSQHAGRAQSSSQHPGQTQSPPENLNQEKLRCVSESTVVTFPQIRWSKS
jgi:hypothetical protein